MSEKVKCFLRGLGTILFQALAVLVLIFIGLWLFGALFIFGALSWS